MFPHRGARGCYRCPWVHRGGARRSGSPPMATRWSRSICPRSTSPTMPRSPPRSTGVEYVAHTAAVVNDYGSMAEFVRVNVGGTRAVLDAAVDAQRVLVLSSVAIWGYEFETDVSEDDPPRPCGNPYIDTKGQQEVLALRRGATVVRPGDVYGPRSEPWILRPLRTMKAGSLRAAAAGRRDHHADLHRRPGRLLRARALLSRFRRPRVHVPRRRAGAGARVLRVSRRLARDQGAACCRAG